MSKADIKNGETAMSQLSPQLVYAAGAGLDIGYIVVATECSGGKCVLEAARPGHVRRAGSRSPVSRIRVRRCRKRRQTGGARGRPGRGPDPKKAR
jgi:hypothetical protein